MNQINTRIVIRNDSTVNWQANDSLVLLKGELGLEFLEGGKVKMKVGDGTSTWAQLPYFGGEEGHVFEATLGDGETNEAAIARVVGDVTPVKGDIAVVKALIATVDGVDKYSYTAYVHNGSAWTAMDGNYNAKNVYFDADMLVTKEIGYITLSNGQGYIPSEGKNLEQVFEAMFVKESNPTKTDPSVSVTLTGAGAYEVGTKVTGVKYSASFEDGKYTYGPEPTGATVSSWAVTDTAGGSYDKASGDLDDVTVTDSTNFSVTAKATHSAGSVPVTNKKNPYPASQISAGTKSKTSSAITGYRSFFYGVLDTSSAEQPLTSALIREGKNAEGVVVDTPLTNGGNYNGAKSFTLNGSATAKRIVIAVPTSSTRGGLSEVILTSAMNTPVTDSYIKTTAAVKVEGVDGATAVDYTVWVYEPSKIDAGEVHAITLA